MGNNGSSGSAFTGQCSGSSNNSPQNITVKLSDDSNIGTKNRQKIPSITYTLLDISKCTYTPKLKQTTLPNKDNNANIAKFYNSNKFIVDNIIVNKSCNQIPRGLIIAFYGKIIPDGWTLCDGTLCTPDLRGRSILGFDSINNKNKIGQIGGDENHLLTIGELPSHNHKYPLSQSAIEFLTDVGGALGKKRFPAKSDNPISDKTYLNETTNSPHNNMPPFVVCSYIMKL